MAREFHGKIPKVPIDADTSKADEKIDRLFQRIKQVEHIEIDANVSQAQRRLETMIKRTNKQMSSDLVNTMLKDFKTVLGAMKTEFQNMGESDIFKGLEKTCNMVEERFSNLTVSIDKKNISGLENILNTAKELQAISGFSFGDVVSKQTVKNTKTVLSDVRATKKEINSIVNKIDYIQKTLDKSEKSALSTDKLSQYEKKLKGLGDSLKGFYDIEDELIQNALVNATSKINKAMGDIKIRMPKVKVTGEASSDKDMLKSLIASEKKAKAIQAVANRISTNSSLKGLKNLEQEAVNVTEVLGKMYDEGIRDTERYITLQYKLHKIFDKLGKGYGGVKGSGARDSSELLDFVIDGIEQKTGVNLFSTSGFAGVMENLFGDADFSLFNKSLSKLAMKDVAELLLITGKTGDWVDMQKQVTVEVKNTADAQIKLTDVVSDAQEDTIKSKKEELDLTKQIGKEEVKATKEAAKAKSKYYEIDEKAARISKQMRSFDDYKEGSATASYKAAVDELATVVEEKKKQFPDKSEQLDQLLDRYAKNLASYINRDNQIGAQYPSVMISGAGNYNIKKHNKQMASWGKNYQFYDEKVLALENKIRNLGSSGKEVIRGDEEGALEKLEAKVEYMKYWHEVMVEVNKYYKKNKTLEGFEGVEPDELERIKKDLAVIKQVGMYDTPYPSYALTNDSQNIKRIEGRIAELKRLKDSDGLQEENDIYKLWTDKQDMRIRISFEIGKPDQEVIDILKGKAFKWSRKNGAWQRQLTGNAIYDAKQVQKSLHEFYKIEEQSNAATVAIEEQTKAIEKLAEARLKLTPKKDGSGGYTAMDGKYDIGQDVEGWKVFQRDNAGLWNLIGTYKHFEDIKNDVSLLTREEIVRTDEVIQQIKTLQEAYQSLRTETGGYISLANKYIEVLDSVKNGAMSAVDAIGQLNEVVGIKNLPTKPVKKLTSSYEGLVEAVEEFVVAHRKRQSVVGMGDDYWELSRIEEAKKDQIMKFVPKDTEAYPGAYASISHLLNRRERKNGPVSAENILKQIEGYIKKANLEISKSKLIETRELIDGLKSTYGDDYDSIFSSVFEKYGNLNTRESEYIYNALIAKEKEYLETIKERENLSTPESGTLEHLVDSLTKLDSISADPLNEIVRSIVEDGATITSEVQEILRSLSLLDDAGNFSGKYITEGMNNSGVITNDKYAIIARTQEHYDEPESYEYDFKEGTTYIDNLIAKEKEAAEQGVNLARVLGRVKSEAVNGKDLFYEIQEFAPGEQLHIFDESKKNIQDFEQECARIVGASSEHIQKLMSDIIKLNELGFYIDFSPANILYDAVEGFKFIDLGLRDIETDAQTVTELMEGLFDCLMDFGDSKDHMKSSMEDAIRWSTSMMSVHNRLTAVFGQNNFGADIGSITSKFSGDFAKYLGQAEQKQSEAMEAMPQLVDNYGKSLDEVNNKLMQGTKLLNEQGQILRLFHNSSEVFDKFDATKAGSNQGQALGKGSYLALKQNQEFNELEYGRYQTQWYANVQNPFNVRDKLTDKQSAEIIDKFMADRAETFKQHMLGKLLDGDVTEAVKDIANIANTTVGEIFGHLGYDAIMDGAQINIFDPSKIHRANDSVLDIGASEFDAYRELQGKIREEQKIIQNANEQIKKLSNQYTGRTVEQLETDLLGEVLLRSFNWRESVAKIASELKTLTGKLPKVEGISEESMRAMVENYEFSKQNLQGYIDEKEKHQKILNQLENQWFNQEDKINTATQSYIKGDIGGIVNKEIPQEVVAQAEAEQKVLDTESKLTPIIEANTEAKQEQIKQAEAHADAERKVTEEFQNQHDIMQQVLLEEFEEIGESEYISPYSSEQISKLSRGAGINKILEDYGVSKSDKGQIRQEIEQLVSMVAEQKQFEALGFDSTDDLPTMIDEVMSSVIDKIHKRGSRKVGKVEQDLLEAFYDYLQGIQIGYSDTEAAEFGDDWADKIKKFGTGRYKILTKDPSAHGIDGIWDEFMDSFSGLLTDKEMGTIHNTQGQLRAFLRIAEDARELHADKSKTTIQALSDEDYDNIATAINSVIDVVEKNTQRMFGGDGSDEDSKPKFIEQVVEDALSR